jgi:hypothetical protein
MKFKTATARRLPEALGGGVARVPLTQGKFALISECDVARVSRHVWYWSKCGRGRAQCDMNVGGRRRPVLLHRFIMDAVPGVMVSARDLNALNCTRENLRYATISQCLRGRRAHGGKGRTSRFKGVYLVKVTGKWRALIQKDGAARRLGSHATEEAAARAYDAAAREMHGEFARLNYPEGS